LRRLARSHPAFAAFLVAAIPRLAACWFFPAPEPNYHYWLSESLLTLHAFAFGDEPTSFIEPGYPAFLAMLRAFSSERIALLLQALVSATGGAAMYRLTVRVTGSSRAAGCAAALYAFDPYFVRQVSSYIELPFLLPVFLWSLERFTAIRQAKSAAAAGAVFGLLLLTRSSLLPAFVGAVALLVLRREWRHAIIVSAVAAAVLMPWTARSYGANHALLPTRVGENLFVSTSRYAVGVLPQHDVDLLIQFAQQLLDDTLPATAGARYEETADRILIAQALQFVTEHPFETLGLKLRNLIWIPSPVLLPRYAKSPYTHAAFIDGRTEITGLRRRPLWWEAMHALARAALLVVALIGLIRRRGLDDAVLLIAMASEAVIHTIFFPTTRLLGPFTAVLMVYAGWGSARMSERILGPVART
jgi:hypothetical protein